MKTTTPSISNNARNMRKRAKVSKSRWLGYAAAGAATAIVGHETAEADITYVNPPDIPISAAPGSTTYALLDLNGDGQTDIMPRHIRVSSPSSGSGIAQAIGAGSSTNVYGAASVAGQYANGGYGTFPYAYNLPFSTPINSQMFVGSGTMAFRIGYGNDEFLPAGPGYLGVRFNSAAGTHLGWMRVVMNGAPDNAFTVTDWAYAHPGESIGAGHIPEPGSLGLLALGGAGLLAWRRKKSEAAA